MGWERRGVVLGLVGARLGNGEDGISTRRFSSLLSLSFGPISSHSTRCSFVLPLLPSYLQLHILFYATLTPLRTSNRKKPKQENETQGHPYLPSFAYFTRSERNPSQFGMRRSRYTKEDVCTHINPQAQRQTAKPTFPSPSKPLPRLPSSPSQTKRPRRLTHPASHRTTRSRDRL